jgi:flagellar basal body-associated protein FliL
MVGESMEKKQIVIIAVALMIIVVAAVGMIWYFSQNEKGAEYKTGVLLSYESGDCEWAAMDTQGLTAAEAYHKARGSNASDDGDGAFLWTISANDAD